MKFLRSHHNSITLSKIPIICSDKLPKNFKKIKDEELLLLFSKIFDTYHKKQNKGLPIGNLISQHVANYYLGYFDHWIKEKLKIKAYLRYMDDFILFSNSKEDLKNILEQVKQYLHEKLALELKNAIQLNRSSFGVPFLGFRIFPHRMNFTPNSKKRFVKKYRRYEYKLMTGQWSESKYVEHAEPLFSFALLGDTKEFRRNVIKRFGVSS